MKKKDVKKNYIYNLIYQVVALILPIISTPYVSRVLGATNVGIYGYTLSISAYFILFGTLGITLYGQREIAYLQKDKKSYSKVFFEIFFLKLIVMTISAIVFYFVFATKNHYYYFYYRILLLELLANAIDINWFFQGLEEFKKTVTRNLIVKLASIISIFIFVKTKEDLPIYFLIYVLSILLGNLSLWISVPKYVCKVKLNTLQIVRHLKPTLIMFVPQVAIQIYTVLDRTMIGRIIEDKSIVGAYTQGENIIKLLLTIITSLGAVMLPRIAACFVQKNYEKIKDYIYKSFNVVFMLSMPMIAGIILVVDMFVPEFFGPGYDRVVNVMIILSPILMLIGMSNVIGVQYLLPTKHQKEYTLSVVFGAIVNFIANLFLISRFRAAGAAIGTVIAETVVTLTQIIFVRKDIKFTQILKIAIKYILPTLIMAGACYLFRRFVVGVYVPEGAKAVIMIAVLGVCVYGLCLIAFRIKFVTEVIVGVLNRVKKILKK